MAATAAPPVQDAAAKRDGWGAPEHVVLSGGEAASARVEHTYPAVVQLSTGEGNTTTTVRLNLRDASARPVISSSDTTP